MSKKYKLKELVKTDNDHIYAFALSKNGAIELTEAHSSITLHRASMSCNQFVDLVENTEFYLIGDIHDHFAQIDLQQLVILFRDDEFVPIMYIENDECVLKKLKNFSEFDLRFFANSYFFITRTLYNEKSNLIRRGD